MRVIVRTHYSEDYGVKDYFEVEELTEKGEQIEHMTLNCHPETPEDNNFERGLSDIMNIESLIKNAYYAGKMGEDLEFSHLEEEW